MYKKILLFIFLLLLTGCTGNHLPANSKNMKDDNYQINVPDAAPVPDNSDSSDTADDPSDNDKSESGREEATKDPTEVLNKVLNDLDELNKLFNGK